MYNGTNKTALTSQQMISDAFFSLLKQKSYSDISVSELCTQAQVSRQTFYTLFETKENIMLYELNHNYTFSLDYSLEEKNALSIQDICYLYSHYLKENASFIQILIDNHLTELLYQQLYHSICSCKRIFQTVSKEKREYIALFIAGGMANLTQKFVLDDITNNTELMSSIMYDLFHLSQL